MADPIRWLLLRQGRDNVKTEMAAAFPVTVEVWDGNDPDQQYIIELTALDAVRLGQKLTAAGRQVHAQRKAEQP